MTGQFSADELRILNLWARNTVSGGHWGDGEVLLGEESGLLDKIRVALESGQGRLDLTPTEWRVLDFWREDNGKAAGRMTGGPSSVSLARKIQDAVKTVPERDTP